MKATIKKAAKRPASARLKKATASGPKPLIKCQACGFTLAHCACGTIRYHLSMLSGNGKTGEMPVSTTGRNSCPLGCALMGSGCYGDNFPLSLHWDQVSLGNRGFDLAEFCTRISQLPAGILWRHNQVGDLPPVPGNRALVDRAAVQAITHANIGKNGFTYTHHLVLGDSSEARSNRETIRQANTNGFAINLSADSVSDADAKLALEIGPVTVVVAETQTTNFRTDAGNLVVICPKSHAQHKHKGITCSDCKGLCARVDRTVIVGFPAHGSRKRLVNERIAAESLVTIEPLTRAARAA